MQTVIVAEGDRPRGRHVDVHAVAVSDLIRLLLGLQVLERGVGKHGRLQRIPSPPSERLQTPAFLYISEASALKNTVTRCFPDDGIAETHREQAGGTPS